MTTTLFPGLVEAGANTVDTGIRVLLDLVRSERERLRSDLSTRGALLFRGFKIGSVDGFDQLVRELSGKPLEYTERSSPRSAIKGQIYTSTDYPPSESIFLHNENSYQASWPRTLFFYCVEPPTTQGATPLADTRRVYRAIDPEVRDEFERRGWMVVRNFHPYFGPDWRHVFGTDDRGAVGSYCAARGIELEWHGESLRTRAVRRAVHEHPRTGERVWFNHATFFHVTTLPTETAQELRALFGEKELPTNTYYGDGGAIPEDVMDHLRDCYRGAMTRFDYLRDDILVIDNMLVSHGREPFTGPRRIAVAMADPSA